MTIQNNDYYADALRDSISTDIAKLALDTMEESLKVVLDSGVIDSFPIVDKLGRGKTIINNINNYFLTKNVLSFLNCIKDVPLEKRVKFMEKISKNTKISHNFSMLLLNILSKIDEDYKAKLIGFVFRKMIYVKIDEVIGTRIIQTISKLSFLDLDLLKNESEVNILNNQVLIDSVSGSGIITVLEAPGANMSLDMEPQQYRINIIGKELICTMNEFEKENII